MKHLRNVSDEQVVAQFGEKACYQYFCGLEAFNISTPCASSELVHFRHRIGEAGMELILKESIRVNLAIEDKKREEERRKSGKGNRGRKSDRERTAFIDSTVQEKNVTYLTDSKLLNKVIEFCRKTARREALKVRQSYAREIKELKLIQRFRGKANSRKKVAMADRRMRTIAGLLIRELLCMLLPGNPYMEHLELCRKFVNGEKIDGHKIYSLHEPGSASARERNTRSTSSATRFQSSACGAASSSGRCPSGTSMTGIRLTSRGSKPNACTAGR